MLNKKQKLYRIFIDEDNIAGFVYFIQIDLYGPIKIGFAKNINKRLQSLRTGSPYPLNLIYLYQGNEEEEQEWHRIYRDICIRGEWFEPHQRLLYNIQEHKKSGERIKIKDAKFQETEWSDNITII